jgi:ribonucleoside-triphosphate reductase
MTPEQYSKWIDVNAYVGVNYFCTNILITCCEEETCGFINKNTEQHCIKCGSKNISHATRIIGFLKKIKNFSKARQEEAALRFYHKDIP